jgi:hypothetical protein
MIDFAKEIQTRLALQTAQSGAAATRDNKARAELQRNQAGYADARRAADFISHPAK